MSNDTNTTPEQSSRRIAKSEIDNGTTLKLAFSNGETITATVNDLANSGVENLVATLALKGLVVELRSAYASVRDNADKAFEAASKRLAAILTEGLESPSESAGPSRTMLDFAIAALAQFKGRTEDEIRAVVDKFTTKTLEDGTVLTVDEQKKALVQKVKNSPETAPTFARLRAESLAKKSKSDAFADF